LFADLPTGDDDTGISQGSTDFGAGLHWNQGMWVVGGQYKIVGDRDAEDNPLGFEVGLADEIRLDVGLNIPLNFWETTNWINEVNAIIYSGGDNIGQPDDIVYLVSGIRHWFGTSGWALNAGVRGNLTMATSDNNSCPFGGLLGISYAPMHLTPPPPPPAVVTPPPPPPPAPTPPPAPVTPPKEPVELRLDELEFEPRSARVTNIAKAILDDVALRMKQEPASTAIVIGYVEPDEGENLARLRAEAVRDYLVTRHDIDPSRITVEGRGAEDDQRRVVIRLIVP
ncbi:MAG: OmpA family protein, partial [Thermoanaerobaculia bacterium]|nr:OmpA family protein [Thermoanaerobaculia bacterium]